MNKYDLSVLIPARNEQFLAQTVQNVLENIRGNTEIIVVLDGQDADPPITIDPLGRVTILFVPESIGQRAATNQACRLSNAKYVMKLDAHCALDEGFDIKLMRDMKDDYTVIPTMYNLHAFDWVCDKCGNSWYQGPTPVFCHIDKSEKVRNEKCDSTSFSKKIIWKPRLGKKSNYYRFDKTLHFQYWGDFERRPGVKENSIVPIMSAQGSCFMLTREKYWELDICDEKSAGKSGWGQQGVEVALKTQLSGGTLVVNKNTWYSHMFRTQGGDFGFPYPISGSEQEFARSFSRDLWLNNKWPKAIMTFEQFLEKWRPIPDWHSDEIQKKAEEEARKRQQGINTKKGILYYTDNQLKVKYAKVVQNRLNEMDIPITSVSLKPMPHFGNNIHLKRERGIETYFRQIIAGLEAMNCDIVYFCEHDVIYDKSHFDYEPPTKEKFYYNQNFWRIRPERDNLAVHWDANQVSGLVCDRQFALKWYKEKLEKLLKDGFDRSYEPGGRDQNLVESWKSKHPNIDIRHGNNLTKSKWSPNDFRDKSTCVNWQESDIHHIPGWEYSDLLCSLVENK